MPENQSESSRERLKGLLRELFQFDSADLDFGIYRIMNQRRDDIERFIEKDLIARTEEAFKEYIGTSTESLQKELKALKEKINNDFGAGTIDEFGEARKNKDSPKVLEYLGKKEELKNAELTQGQIDDVYNRVYEFFSRYYDSGDFVSKRRFGGKDKYVVPYNGEEIRLYWANKDQYYVKTAENFTNYDFVTDGWAVSFIIIKAEVEQNNVKGKDRFFLMSETTPPSINVEEKKLSISFEYRELTEIEERGLKKKDKQRNIIENILEKLARLVNGSPLRNVLFKKVNVNGENINLIEKHLSSYVTKNTSDYFIHKDIKRFLSRELDFFIKNEVLQVDELVGMDNCQIKQNISRVRAIKEISTQIIEFLNQIENLQKKLFEKKKFVLRSEYLITLDQIPNKFYPAISVNESQIAEWRNFIAIDDITKDTIYPTKGRQTLDIGYLAQNPHLMINTKYFDLNFCDNLFESINNIDDKINGVLIKSENWQALNTLVNKYFGTFKGVYIDPPYNTDASSIIYKNNYKDSSWLSLMEDRIIAAHSLLKNSGIICAAIDDVEVLGLRYILSEIFSKEIGIATVRSNPAGRKTKGRLAPAHEYALFYGKSEESMPGCLDKNEKSLARYPSSDEKGRFAWANFIRSGSNDKREDRPKLFYPIFVHNDDSIRIPHMHWDESLRQYILDEQPNESESIVLPTVEKDCVVIEKNWQRGHQRAALEINDFRVRRATNGRISIDFKTYMDEESLPITWWDNNEYASANYGAAEMKNLFGSKIFDFAKSRRLVEDCLKTCDVSANESVIDFFGGSGTTGRAIISLNREDGGNRRYVLVEMGTHFESALKPGIIKTVFSEEWRDGKPVLNNSGVPHIVKCIYLESYEDTLNNIVFLSKNRTLQETLENYSDYYLKYVLETETRDSPSRLSIGAFSTPFSFVIKTVSGGKERTEQVDLVETFNYLLGLHINNISARYDGERYYKSIRGKKRDDKNILIIWRSTESIDLIRDKKFIENEFVRDSNPDIIYINGMCLVEGALPIEPDFKKLMGA